MSDPPPVLVFETPSDLPSDRDQPGVGARNGAGSRNQWRLVGRRFARHRLAVISLTVVAVLYVSTYFAEEITGYRYDELSDDLRQRPSSRHWFGTDDIGHDVLAQTLRGTQVSLHLALLVAIVATFLGALVGATQGWFRAWTDSVLGAVTELFLILPALAVLLVLSLRGGNRSQSLVFIALIIALFQWSPLARIVRAEVASLREREFIEAARAIGAGNARIIGRHLLPNTIGSVIVYGTLTVATAILIEATLAFLGFGIRPPDISLGTLVDEGKTALETAWWLFYLPGGVLIVLLLCINFVGDGLRDALDPTQRRRRG